MKINAKAKKIVKKSSMTLGVVVGLAAIPMSVAIGLGVGIKDDVIDSSFSSAVTYGQKFFDNNIVKVQDDTFTSNILYTFDKNDNEESSELTNDELEKEKLSTIGDISGLVRLDRKIDVQYAKSVVNLDSEENNGGKIQTDGSLIFDFNNIEEDVEDENGIHHFGKDKVAEYEAQARAILSAAVKKHQEKHQEDKTMHFGVFFDKHASSRRVSIYLYELKKFEEEGELDEQGKLISDFVDTVDRTPVTGENWANLWDYNGAWTYKTDLGMLDKIDLIRDKVTIDNLGNLVNKTSDTIDGVHERGAGGFPEIFAGTNLFRFSTAHWYNMGWQYADNYDEMAVSADGKTMLKNVKNKNDKDGIDMPVTENALDGWKWYKDYLDDNSYFNSFVDENNNKFLGNANTNDIKSGHTLGVYQFASKGLFVTVRPALDYVNDVLKLVFTFKSFREKGMNGSRSLINYNLGTNDIDNPYKASTFIKKIPLAKFGNEGEHGEKDSFKIDSPKSRNFESFYVDDKIDIMSDPPTKEEKLKESVLKSSFKPIFTSGNIGKEEAKEVIKRFYSQTLTDFLDIPIVSPGLGILGSTIPELGSALSSWIELGNISAKMIEDPRYYSDYTFDPENYENITGNKTTYKLLNIFNNDKNSDGYNKYADELLEKIIATCDEKEPLRSATFINIINNFNPIAWSDLDSLISLKGYPYGGERTARTFELFHLVFGTSAISDLLTDAIKKEAPEIYAGNYTTILDDLLKWLIENGVIKKSTSLLDIIGDYQNQLPTIIEAIGINKPRMDIKMIQGIINLIPLDLFSDSDSIFNKDIALMLDYLLNVDDTFSSIVNLLDGNGRTSIGAFLSHIFNDKPDILLKYIGGLLGASHSNSITFSKAFHSIINTLKAGGDTFGDVGKALENIYNDGINSIELESIESIFNFIDFIGPSFGLDSLSVSGINANEVSQSIFNLLSNGVNLNAQDVSNIIKIINFFVKKELLPETASLAISKIMTEGVSQITASDLDPIASLLNPILKGALSYGDDVVNDDLSNLMLHLFNGWPDAETFEKELIKLIPSIENVTIPVVNLAVPELIKAIYENDVNKFSILKYSLVEKVKENGKVVGEINHLERISKLLHNGLSGMADNDWDLFVTSIKIIIDTVVDFKDEIGITDDIVNVLDVIFKGANSVEVIQSVGHIFSKGLSKLESVDYQNILKLVNKLDELLSLGFSIPEKNIESLSNLAANILQNGVNLTSEDVDTILDLAINFGGTSVSDFIDSVNEGNPSQKEGFGAPDANPNAFRNLILGFIVGHK